MDRFALLVDAGYFYAAGAKITFGDWAQRRDIYLTNPRDAIDDLVKRSQQSCGGIPLLRTYWYDAMLGNELSQDQVELALLDSLKLRLGILNEAGQQKGVDALIVTDLIELARNRAISDAVVLSGDEDVRIGVQVAQSYGLRVHLLAVGDVSGNVSHLLRREVDTLQVLGATWFEGFFQNRMPGPASAAETGPGMVTPSDGPAVQYLQVDHVAGESLRETTVRVSKELVSHCDQRELDELCAQLEVASIIPAKYDGRLIATVSKARGGGHLTTEEREEIRGVFTEIIQEGQGNKSGKLIPGGLIPGPGNTAEQ